MFFFLFPACKLPKRRHYSLLIVYLCSHNSHRVKIRICWNWVLLKFRRVHWSHWILGSGCHLPVGWLVNTAILGAQFSFWPIRNQIRWWLLRVWNFYSLVMSYSLRLVIGHICFCVFPIQVGWYIGITLPCLSVCPSDFMCRSVSAGDSLVSWNTCVLFIYCLKIYF